MKLSDVIHNFRNVYLELDAVIYQSELFRDLTEEDRSIISEAMYQLSKNTEQLSKIDKEIKISEEDR